MSFVAQITPSKKASVLYNKDMTLFSLTHWFRILTAAGILLSLSLEDLRTERISPRRTLLLAGTALLRLLTAGASSGRQLLFMFTGSALLLFLLLAFTWLMDRFLGRETLGGGDIKLTAALALHLGFFRSVLMLLFACLLALAGALLFRRSIRSRFPFVPYLSLSAIFFLITG